MCESVNKSGILIKMHQLRTVTGVQLRKNLAEDFMLL